MPICLIELFLARRLALDHHALLEGDGLGSLGLIESVS
jgi:hypothetical protein